ncbi:MAG: hypothetical protein JWQ40_994 [Segetibacter sp.]|jgi:hypothetical protein|nr:hypothetical protein [Segetibacter sp.]
MQTGEGNKVVDTFPSQELPCSGSTGLISASSICFQHPGEETGWFLCCKNNCEKLIYHVTFFDLDRLT